MPQRSHSSPDSDRSLAEVAGMSLRRFSEAGLILEVKSSLLGETVLLASDNAVVRRDENRPVYRCSEIRGLLEQGPVRSRRMLGVKSVA